VKNLTIRVDILEAENKSLCEMVKSLQEKNSRLQMRVREYGIELPISKTDFSLVCPTYTKSIEENNLLLKVLDATSYLLSLVTKKRGKISRES
jgi:hypothetical protein